MGVERELLPGVEVERELLLREGVLRLELLEE